ncbi:MAG: hypothetical protein ACXVPN_05080 [Bacteroidia bacterium]
MELKKNDMIAAINSASGPDSVQTGSESFLREEIIHLSGEQTVSEIIKFNPGETCFKIEANIVRRDYLLLCLGGFDMSGHITTFRSRDFDKEFSKENFQWVIVKAEHLKKGQELTITIRFK